MSKSKEELNKLKEEVETVNKKLQELTEEELEQVTGGSNISTMLEGKVPGVQITSDGQSGADPSVRIRGRGSFGSTAPLYVID